MTQPVYSVLVGALILGVTVGCSDADGAGENVANAGGTNSASPAPDSPALIAPNPTGLGDVPAPEQTTAQPGTDNDSPAATPDSPDQAPVEAPSSPGNASAPSDSDEPAPDLPLVNGSCPVLSNDTVDVTGAQVRLWVGSTPGPVYFYFHGTGSSPTEVNQGLPGATEAVVETGGVVASFAATNGRGSNTGNGVWFTGDFEAADQILACAVQAGLVDTRRVYAAGYSAGGLQTGAMLFARSSYLASVIVYSGGKGLGAGPLQDPNNVPPALFAHGAVGSDVVVLDFAQRSMAMSAELLQLGGFAVDCNDGGSHVALSRLGVQGAALEFLAAHPFGTSPSPYAAMLPATFPDFCQIVQ